jgi:hypothetical protein
MAGNCGHHYDALSCIKLNQSLYKPEEVIRVPEV